MLLSGVLNWHTSIIFSWLLAFCLISSSPTFFVLTSDESVWFSTSAHCFEFWKWREKRGSKKLRAIAIKPWNDSKVPCNAVFYLNTQLYIWSTTDWLTSRFSIRLDLLYIFWSDLGPSLSCPFPFTGLLMIYFHYRCSVTLRSATVSLVAVGECASYVLCLGFCEDWNTHNVMFKVPGIDINVRKLNKSTKYIGTVTIMPRSAHINSRLYQWS